MRAYGKKDGASVLICGKWRRIKLRYILHNA